jgi:hypothetical protein
VGFFVRPTDCRVQTEFLFVASLKSRFSERSLRNAVKRLAASILGWLSMLLAVLRIFRRSTVHLIRQP